jgi:hypothetical protein
LEVEQRSTTHIRDLSEVDLVEEKTTGSLTPSVLGVAGVWGEVGVSHRGPLSREVTPVDLGLLRTRPLPLVPCE